MLAAVPALLTILAAHGEPTPLQSRTAVALQQLANMYPNRAYVFLAPYGLDTMARTIEMGARGSNTDGARGVVELLLVLASQSPSTKAAIMAEVPRLGLRALVTAPGVDARLAALTRALLDSNGR